MCSLGRQLLQQSYLFVPVSSGMLGHCLIIQICNEPCLIISLIAQP